jgi:hypothetical protein
MQRKLLNRCVKGWASNDDEMTVRSNGDMACSTRWEWPLLPIKEHGVRGLPPHVVQYRSKHHLAVRSPTCRAFHGVQWDLGLYSPWTALSLGSYDNSVIEQWSWLQSTLRGCSAYYATPWNYQMFRALRRFCESTVAMECLTTVLRSSYIQSRKCLVAT